MGAKDATKEVAKDATKEVTRLQDWTARARALLAGAHVRMRMQNHLHQAARFEILAAKAFIFVVLVYNMGGHIHQNLDQACNVDTAAACATALAGSDTRKAVTRQQLAEENAVPVCAATARDCAQRYYSTHYLGSAWFPYIIDPSSVAHCTRCASEAQPGLGASSSALFLRSLRPSCLLSRADMTVFVNGIAGTTGAAVWSAFANLGATSTTAAAVCAPLGPGAAWCMPIMAALMPLWTVMKTVASDVATTPRVVDTVMCFMISAAFLLTYAPRKAELRYFYPNPYAWSWQVLAVWVCVLQAIFHANCESVERMMVATYTQYLLNCMETALQAGWVSLVGLFGAWLKPEAVNQLVLDPASNEYSHWFSMYQLRRMKVLAGNAAAILHEPACKKERPERGSQLELQPMRAKIGDQPSYTLPAMCTHGLRPWSVEDPYLARDGIFTANGEKLARTAPRLQQNYYLQLQGACSWVAGRRKHVLLYFEPTAWDEFGGPQAANQACQTTSPDTGVDFGVTRRPLAQDEGDPRDYVPLWTTIRVRLASGRHERVRCDVLLHSKNAAVRDIFELHPTTSGFGGIKSVGVPVTNSSVLGIVSKRTFGYRCPAYLPPAVCADNHCSERHLAKNVLVLVHPSDAHKLLRHETALSLKAPLTADATGGEVLIVPSAYQMLSAIARDTPYTDLGLLDGAPSLVPAGKLGRYRPALECGICAMYNSAEEASKLRDGEVPRLRDSMRATSSDMQALAEAGILGKRGSEWHPCDCNRVLERNREQHRQYMMYA